MLHSLRRFIPTPEQIRNNRWLGWLGPSLHNPRLWHWSRRGVALGVALGMFFGLLVPIAQIPLAAAATVLLRANLPVAVVGTLITNPLTLGPIYYGAYRVGTWVFEDKAVPGPDPVELSEEASADPPENVVSAWQRTVALGKLLAVGLALLASATGIVAYALTHCLWRVTVLYRRRKGRRP